LCVCVCVIFVPNKLLNCYNLLSLIGLRQSARTLLQSVIFNEIQEVQQS